MASLFEKAEPWLPARMKQAGGKSVTYARAGSSDVTLTVWVGRTLFAIEGRGEGAARVEWGERDYLIAAADMADAGLGVPQVGDRITEVLPVEGAVTFELMPDSREPPWRWSDADRTTYRLHVKQVG
jgi:hypothetical protein